MNPLAVFSPAKINLFLAITGRRADGFHDLVSLVAPVDFGDELILERNDKGVYSLACDNPDVPLGSSNLVLRAAELFSEATKLEPAIHFRLIKRVPLGAGLGGGSSNGTAALVGLNRVYGSPLSGAQLGELAAKLGSDCVLFLQESPCVMRGRGERIEELPLAAVARLRGQRVLLFKPSFGIATAWAFREVAAQAPASYLSNDAADGHLKGWLAHPTAPVEQLVRNTMESVAFAKFLALPTLLELLRSRFSVAVGMSGSGSACFALLAGGVTAAPLIEAIRDAWGEETFVAETRIR